MTTEVRDLVVTTYSENRWAPCLETGTPSKQQSAKGSHSRDNEVIIRECVERVIEALRAQAGEAATKVVAED